MSSFLYSLKFIIATPGRLLEILRQKAVKLDKVKVVVVDEVCQAFTFINQHPAKTEVHVILKRNNVIRP